jgi:hypothetical protein
MLRRARFLLLALLAGALVVAAMLPRSAMHTAAPPVSTVRGAYHIHSNRSDGSGTPDAIAAAAASAGLQFIILTDHGDGTRPPDPPSYRHGVLVIDAVELNTTRGHYAVLGMPASPYPIAGTPEDVIEDVRRLGGFGIAAHPGSPRASLSWQGWDAPIDGLEWINGDSEWRDEPRMPLARALLTYVFRAPESMATLLDRPSGVLARWDALAQTRRVVGLAGTDAHARLGVEQRSDPDTGTLHVRVPGYAPAFRMFSNHVVLEAPPSGNADADAAALLDAIRRGHVYSVIDALATPGALAFSATSGSQSAQAGDLLPIDGDVLLKASAEAPPGTTLVLLRNGQRIHEVTGGTLEMNGGKDPAEYRIEAYTPDPPGGPSVPWIVSNPIYAGLANRPAAPVRVPEPVSRIPARTAEAAAEKGASDVSTVVAAPLKDDRARTFAGDPAITWTYALGPGTAAGQFAAVAIPVSPGLATFDRIRFVATAAAPTRAWVQLRAGSGDAPRYGATFYVDQVPRTIDIPFAKFAPIGEDAPSGVPLDRAAFLMFVVDTVNTLPGTKGSMVMSEVAFVK